MKIESYKLQNGETRYKFNAYLGLDPLTGKEIRTNRRGFKTKKQAQLEYVKLVNTGIINKDNITFKQATERWLPIYKTTVKPATYQRVCGVFRKHIFPYIGDKKIETITTDIMQELIMIKSTEIVEFKLINSYTSMVFKFAKQQKYCKENPCLDVIYPKRDISTVEEETINYWTKEEAVEFLNYCKTDLAPVYYTYHRLSIYTGARRGELLALKWSDINFTKHTIRINKSLSRNEENTYSLMPPKTKSSNRTISIDPETISILKQWKKYQIDQYKIMNINNFVFTDLEGNHLNIKRPRSTMIQIIKKHNLRRIRLHDQRHTHASLCFEAGMDIKEVQYRLGHSNIKTTLNIYVHLTKTKEKQSFDKFATFMKS